MSEDKERLILSCEGVWKVFPSPEGPIRALRDVTLAISEGQFVVVRGVSGSGKSTLLSLLGALDRPTTGHVLIQGKKTSELSAEEAGRLRRNLFGFVLPEFPLISHLTAEQNVALGRMFEGRPIPEVFRQAFRLLEEVGISQRARHVPSELSVGERLRVTIARALAREPKVLFADEPTANLDAISAKLVLELLKAKQMSGTTIVVVSHDDRADDYADVVHTLADGRLSSSTKGKGAE